MLGSPRDAYWLACMIIAGESSPGYRGTRALGTSRRHPLRRVIWEVSQGRNGCAFTNWRCDRGLANVRGKRVWTCVSLLVSTARHELESVGTVLADRRWKARYKVRLSNRCW